MSIKIMSEAEVLERLRKRRPNQTEVARELHVSRSFVNRVYRGKAKPTVPMLRLADVEKREFYVDMANP